MDSDLKWGLGALVTLAAGGVAALMYVMGDFHRYFPRAVSGTVVNELAYTPEGSTPRSGRIYTIRGDGDVVHAAIGSDPFNVGDDISVKLGEEVGYVNVDTHFHHLDGRVEVRKQRPRMIVEYEPPR